MATDSSTPDRPEWASHPSYLQAAAWIPDHDDNIPQWDEMEQRAVDWIEDRARIEDESPIVFLNAKKASGGPGPVQDLARRVGISYPLDRSRPARGPVLAYYPDAQSLDRATSLAHGSSLVVIESTLTPLRGWAAAVRAEDLSGIFVPPPTLDPEAQHQLDRAIFFTGNNNWTGPHERDHARKALAEVVRNGCLRIDDAVGYALGHAAVHENGAKNLRKLLEQLARY